jgi:cell division protein FtsX
MTILQPENNIVSRPNTLETEHQYHTTHENLHGVDTDKKIEEMAREAYLMRREIAIIAGIFFLVLIGVVLFAIGSMTQVHLPI